MNSVALAQQRVALRVRMGGHAIPPDVIERRYARSVQNFRSLYLPIADEWRVFDNSDSSNARRVADGGADLLTQIFEEPTWNMIQSI